MAPVTRRRSESRSEPPKERPKSTSRERRGKRDRSESQGEASVKSADTTPPPVPEKPAPTMDVIVHRIRCLKFHPKPILAMKATPSWSPASLIALSRENGCVELKAVDLEQ